MAGIYIHIPFCKQACTYCNFHFSTSLQHKDNLIQSLIQEINEPNSFIDYEESIDTIYFGGGTPSLLSKDQLEKILDALSANFKINYGAEITFEANPDDINPESLDYWKNTGINRLSVGIQSFDPEELKWMNRAHRAKEAMSCLHNIRDAGFQNFSVDLIYGSPLLQDDQLIENCRVLFQQQVPHISCYALTVEPKTALSHLISAHKTEDINTNKQADQFEILLSQMKENGYEQYEISNFCVPGFRSKHNSSYWQGKPYWGFGPAAHSFNGNNLRRWNIANNALYIKSIDKHIIPFEEERLTTVQQMNEYIMISLRTMEGISLVGFIKRFGKEQSDKLLKNTTCYVNEELLTIQDMHVILTAKGKFLGDGIAAGLFF
ncbi:MAG: radical SAM family heme chaperone HemW [Niastella sp.]|nr:radical SAM family heme chaperone HemW [Niastella sp.]